MNETDREIRAEVLEVFKENLGAAIYRRMFKGEYDPEKRSTGAPAPSEHQVNVQKDATRFVSLGSGFDRGSAVEAGTIQLSIPAAQIDFEPAAGDEIDVDGRTYIVVSHSAKYGLDLPVIWQLQVKHG